MSIREAYSDWAATYDLDRNLTRDLDHTVSTNVLANFRCRSVLELGCGTGKNTRLLAQIAERVHSLDFAPEMIEKAKNKLPAVNVDYEVADITQPWPCRDSSHDLVVSNLVLEHVRDLHVVFSEAFRVLVPGGQFFVCELHPMRQYQGKRAIFRRDGEAIAIDAFVHHLADFTDAGAQNGFLLARMNEWWHEEDKNEPPRLLSLLFAK